MLLWTTIQNLLTRLIIVEDWAWKRETIINEIITQQVLPNTRVAWVGVKIRPQERRISYLFFFQKRNNVLSWFGVKPSLRDFLAGVVFWAFIYEFQRVFRLYSNEISKSCKPGCKTVYINQFTEMEFHLYPLLPLHLNICHKFGTNVDKEWY